MYTNFTYFFELTESKHLNLSKLLNTNWLTVKTFLKYDSRLDLQNGFHVKQRITNYRKTTKNKYNSNILHVRYKIM